MLIDSNKLIGKVLGTCVLERQIGRGGMSAVYMARQTRPRRSVAVKVLQPALALDERGQEDFLARFRREADAVAALDHIHIMPLYEYGEQDQQAYLVMPYVTGGTLRKILATRGSLALPEVLPVLDQIAEALDYAHERGIIHRDIKPGNILFHADGRLLLADFGLAKVLSETSEIPVVLTAQEKSDAPTSHDSPSISHGAMVGTPEYLSPEQALGKPVDRRTDIYALGIVVFQMLTGRVPFISASPITTAIMHTQSEPPAPSSITPTISSALDAVILRAIAKDPARRYDSAGEFAAALHQASDEYKQSTRPYRQPSMPFTQLLLSNDTEPEMEQVTSKNEVPSMSRRALAQEQSVSEKTPEPQVMTPAPPPVLLPQPSRRRAGPLLVILSSVLILALATGALFVHYRQPAHVSQNVSSPSSSLKTQPPVTPALTATAAATQEPALNAPLISVGKRLYASTTLNSSCAGGSGSWNQDTNAAITCEKSAIELTNTLKSSHYLASMFLNGLSNGDMIPNDYVLQVSITQAPNSQGSFGILLRNQPDTVGGPQKGAYAFLIDPTRNMWDAIVYDNTTGAATTLAEGTLTTSLTGRLTFDISVQGTAFTFYLNGQYQGNMTSPTYPSGSLGFSVNPGTDIYLSNLAIYHLPGA